MKNISDIFQNRPSSKPEQSGDIRSERDEQIERFYQRRCINVRDAKTKKLRLASRGELALILKDCPTEDLHAFYRQCEAARSFPRWFWYSVKRKKQAPQQCQNGAKD